MTTIGSRRLRRTAVVLALCVALVAAPAAGAIGAPGAVASTSDVDRTIDSCRVIDEPGSYEIVDDIDSDTDEPCLHVRASDVVIDGNGHTVTGSTADGSLGLLVYRGESRTESSAEGDRLTGVTVRDVAFSTWDEGIQLGADLGSSGPRVTLRDVSVDGTGGVALYSASGSVLRDVTVTDSDNIGIFLWETNDVRGRNVEVVGSDRTGLYLDTVSDSRFVDLRSVDNDAAGINFGTEAYDNVVRDAVVKNNAGPGVRFSDSSDNTVAESRIVSNGGPGVSADFGTRERIEDVLIRGNDGPTIEVRAGSMALADVRLGGGGVVDTPGDEPVELAGDNGPMTVDTVSVDDVLDSDAPAGDAFVDRVVSVENSGVPIRVGYAVEPPSDDAEVEVWSRDDGGWTFLAAATGTVPTVPVSGSAVAVPFAVEDDGGGTGVTGDGSLLEIRSTEDNQFDYEIVIDGEASKSRTEEIAADRGDEVRERDDGTVVVSGSTGDNAGDAFEFTGEILSVRISGVDDGYRILVDGEDVTDEVTG